jgi:spermidine synthase
VVRAAHNGNLLSQAVKLQLGDALTYQPQHNDFFDAIFVDIFDSDNLLPKEFYSKAFLERMYKTYLGAHPDGIVIHNFHTGGKARGAQLEDAIKGYRSVFSTTLAVESVGSYHTGGNTILLATNKIRLDASSETLSWYVAGRKAQERCGINFDILARTTNKLWLS